MSSDLPSRNSWLRGSSLPKKLYQLYRWKDHLSPIESLRALRVLTRSYGGVTTIDLPGYRFPFAFRPETTDVLAIAKVLIMREYAIDMPSPPRFIIDAGANIGSASVYFANRYPDATVLAVEPAGSNLELLKRNSAPYKNIMVVEGGVWSRSTYLSIITGNGDADSFKVTESETETDLRAYSVEDLKQIAGFQHIDIFKVDVEGSEIELFSRGELEWLKHVSVIQIELHDRYMHGCACAFYRAIADRNYLHAVTGENTVVQFL